MARDAEVIVVGAGPAGICASIQLRRYGRDVALFEGAVPGGLLRNAWLVENYPGFPGGIRGADLAALFRGQLEGSGVAVINERVESLEYREWEGGGRFTARSRSALREAAIALVASGTVPLTPRGISIGEGAAQRVFYEAVEAEGIGEKRFAVIGGGDAAFDYALTLAERNDVIIITRGSEPRCMDLLARRCDENPSIARLCGVEVKGIAAGEGALELECAGVADETESRGDEDAADRVGAREKQSRGDSGGTFPAGTRVNLEADYVVIAAGRFPSLDFIGPDLHGRFDSLQERGLLYLAGDVCNGIYRQAAISAGDGLRAAMRIERKLRGEEE
ncbi:MAG: NAD(P)/FAD-dependent oxidoreductase [Candidatus Krumholzibacteria bacterium]|jgi:thioredoxin reductase|nr:NAD(P)/FAD-dependent oxidoreductase [Candidatus Krumholzibacteria bacterium]